MNVKEWILFIQQKSNKKAMPILTFPAIQKMGISVKELINDSDLQAQAMKIIVDECDPLASLGFMDLSVEAECFGSTIRVSDGEVPTVIGSIINTQEQAEQLCVPEIGTKRTKVYIEAIKKAKGMITDRPVFAGAIGPFSLAGRLMDVSEAMMYCYDDPDMVHVVLEKVTKFTIAYCKSFKEVGADGVVLAEPLAGVLSPALADEFSSAYVKRIIDAVCDDTFTIIYHNCGNTTVKMVDSLVNTGAKILHFGNSVDLGSVLPLVPKDHIVMGNIDPVGDIKDGTVENVIEHTQLLLKRFEAYDNFIISTGCDVPPLSKWENIYAFMKTSTNYYGKE